MIINEEILYLFKEYLNDLHYPFIKQKSDEDIKKLFQKENRIFLVYWIISKLNSAYTEQLEEAKKNNKLDTSLANIIHENGFCRLSEKNSFFKGDLDDETQIQIFKRMFHFLSLTLLDGATSKENMSAEDQYLKHLFEKPTREEFLKQIMFDVNLIPSHGDFKSISEIEINKKVQSYKEEIKRLKKFIESQEKINISPPNEENNVEDIDIEEIVTLVDNFKEVMNKFSIENMNCSETDITTNNIELANFVESSSENLNYLLKYLNEKHDLNNALETENNLEDNAMKVEESSEYVSNNFTASENILGEIKRSQT